MRMPNLHKVWMLLLTGLLLLSMLMVSAEQPSPKAEKKIEALLLEKMQSSDTRFSVYVWMKDLDYTDMYREIDEIMGPQWQFTGSETEWIEKYLSLEREMKSRMLAEYTEAFIQQAGIQEEDLILRRTEAPMVAVWLTSDDIYRLAEMDQVTALYYMDVDANAEPEWIIYPYTVTHARRILEAVVGKRIGHINWEYDVDGDGVITIIDARLALQHAVGKITIRWPEDKFFPE